MVIGAKPIKQCKLCKQTKELSKFYAHKNTKDFLRNECKKCWKILCEQHRQKNLERARLINRKNYYKGKYNISLEEVDALHTKHKVCEICKEEFNLVIDHDHKTGSIRGMLCNPCNQGLGSFKDKPDLLDKAAGYLRSRTH